MKEEIAQLAVSLLKNTTVNKKQVSNILDHCEHIYNADIVKKGIKNVKISFLGSYLDNDKPRKLTDVISGEYISKKKRKELTDDFYID